jgi:hypothetical protein
MLALRNQFRRASIAELFELASMTMHDVFARATLVVFG